MDTAFDERKVRTWKPAVPCKAPDNIISSRFTTFKAFIPSYERELRPCIEQLLTNEYQRIWWQEKRHWDNLLSTQIRAKKILRRMVVKKQPPAQVPKDKFPKPKKIMKKKSLKDAEKKTEKIIKTEKTETDETAKTETLKDTEIIVKVDNLENAENIENVENNKDIKVESDEAVKPGNECH